MPHTHLPKEVSNCGDGKVAKLKQNNIGNLMLSANITTTIKTDKSFTL
jgi:hypothetical protein